MNERSFGEYNEATPDIELAGSLQSVLKELEQRDYHLDIQQQESVRSIGHALLGGQRTGYIEMATSTGKTVIESIVAESAIRADRRVLLLAPTVAIARQIIGSDGLTGLGRFTDLPDETSVGSHFGSSRANIDDKIVVSTYTSFLRDVKNHHAELGYFDVVIGDECHRSLGQETARAMTESFPKAIKLGFSATPDFATDRTSEEVFGQKIFEFSLSEAIESGKTAPLRTLIYETDEKVTLTDYRAEFTEKELAPLIHNIERNGTAHQLALEFVADGRQGIISCIPGNANSHARLLADMLTTSGVRAADIGSHLGLEEQLLRLKRFQDGDLDVLTFTKTLQEGWDSEKASFCINACPTASPVRTKQLMGRVLRKNPDGRESIYIDFVDKNEGISKTQYTALHALGLETIETERILGRQTSTNGGLRTEHQNSLHVSEQLYAKLRRNSGKLLSEVMTDARQDTQDPVTQYWDKLLEKEGLPSELHANIALPASLVKKYDKAYDAFVRDNQVEPTAADIIKLLPNITVAEKKLLGQYGTRAYDAEPISDITEQDDYINPVTRIEQKQLGHVLLQVVTTIPPREAGMIALSFGIIDGEDQSNKELAARYDITTNRIGQLVVKSLSKLRHPSRSTALWDFMYDKEHESVLDEAAEKEFRYQKANKTIEQRIHDKYWNTYWQRYVLPTGPLFDTIKSNSTGEPVLDVSTAEMLNSFGLYTGKLNASSVDRRKADLLALRDKVMQKHASLSELPTRPTTIEQRHASLSLLESRARLYETLAARLDTIAETLGLHSDKTK